MIIEIDLTKLERGIHEGRVKVTRGGKTFWRKQRVGRKEEKYKTGDANVFSIPCVTFPIIDKSVKGLVKSLNSKKRSNFGEQLEVLRNMEKNSTGEEKKIVQTLIEYGMLNKVEPKIEPKIELKVEPKVEISGELSEIAKYKGISGIIGLAPEYNSLPHNFNLNDNVMKKMNSFRNDSKSRKVEVGCGITFSNNKMDLGAMEIGGSSSLKIEKETRYGIYHTHPGRSTPDIFSIEDVLFLVNDCRSRVMIAHSCQSDHLWVAISSVETSEITKKLNKNEIKDYSTKIKSMLQTTKGRTQRNAIKKFCDRYKIGLYVGKSNESLKKYDGSW